MNYIILDLEWNQSPDGKENENKNIPFEIIEIGAVKINYAGMIIDKFSEVIRPVIYKEIHFKTKEVIGLQMEELKTGRDFKSSCEKFLNWCGGDYFFCTWGSMDLTELQRNMDFYEITSPFPYPFFYYDLQKIFSIAFEDSKARRTLEYAVDFFHIEKKNNFHRALSDASYTAAIFSSIDRNTLNKNFSVDYYQNPKAKKDEIYVVYDQYSKFISREFDSKEAAMGDREVHSTVCFRCGTQLKKRIKWFTTNTRTHYALGICPTHGYLKAKIRMKKSENGKYYAVKIIKLISDDQAQEIYQKKDELRKRRLIKKQQKKINIIAEMQKLK